MKPTLRRALRLFPLLPVLLTLVGANTSVLAQTEAERVKFFESRIRPVLIEHCYQCHSVKAASSGKIKGDLQLDTREGTRRGGDTGPAVVPGKPEKSLLLSALRHDGLEMPPKKNCQHESSMISGDGSGRVPLILAMERDWKATS